MRVLHAVVLSVAVIFLSCSVPSALARPSGAPAAPPPAAPYGPNPPERVPATPEPLQWMMVSAGLALVAGFLVYLRKYADEPLD